LELNTTGNATRADTVTGHPAGAAGVLSLRISKLVFAYGQRWLFEGFDAQAGAGVTWVQGANGSGKSTLLRLLAGALAPRHGTFELAGQRFAAGDRIAPLAWRRQTFWCLSDPPPTPWLTIAECLGFVSGTYADASAQRLREQVDALGLANALATPLRDASLGQQRKTLLALALALPVKLLLLDEPFNALDAASARHLADTLTARAAQGGQVILLTSHVEPHVPVRDRWILGS
jgi:ABC-2 type transport system ATP-binding protein